MDEIKNWQEQMKDLKMEIAELKHNLKFTEEVPRKKSQELGKKL